MATPVIPQHKRKFSTLTAETPRQTGSGAYHAGGLFEKAHTTALDDLGSWIPQVSIVFVLDNILPPVRCNCKVAKVRGNESPTDNGPPSPKVLRNQKRINTSRLTLLN